MPAAIAFRLSGGAANANHLLSIGGVASSVSATADSIFDTVTADEALAQDTEYRKIFIVNSGTQAFTEVRFWISDQPTVGVYAVSLDTGGINTDGKTVVDENTAPVTQTFSTPSTYATGISLGAMAVSARFPIWIRRTIAAGSAGASLASNTAEFSVRGDFIPV